MGWPAHDPELYDELQKQAFLNIIEDLIGELSETTHELIHSMENFYYWMEAQFGSQFAMRVCQEAEADYWSGLIQAAMDRKEETGGEKATEDQHTPC